MTDIREVAVGARIECANCGETLVRKAKYGDKRLDFVEVATGQQHDCWNQLPEDAEHLRLG